MMMPETKWGAAWLWTWRVGVRLFYLVVIGLVLSAPHDPQSVLILACGLLVYTCTRHAHIGLAQQIAAIGRMALVWAEKAGIEESDAETKSDYQKRLKAEEALVLIESSFLAIATIMGVLAIFGHLN